MICFSVTSARIFLTACSFIRLVPFSHSNAIFLTVLSFPPTPRAQANSAWLKERHCRAALLSFEDASTGAFSAYVAALASSRLSYHSGRAGSLASQRRASSMLSSQGLSTSPLRSSNRSVSTPRNMTAGILPMFDITIESGVLYPLFTSRA